MRKFLALIMTIIILLGTLSPVVFELGGVQQKFELKKQLAMADNTNVETTFDNTPNTAVSIEKVAGKPKFFKLVTKIKYNYAVTPDNEPFQEVAFALGGVLDPNAIILKKDSQIKIYENDIDPAPSGLHNNRWGYIAQEFEITNDGVYQGWFWENYTWPKEDLESSKLEFEIKNGEIVSQKIYQYATNQRNAINVVFNVPVVAIDETKPTTATVTGTVTYSDITNPTAQSNTNAPINISWELFDSETNEKISTKTISINPIPKLNTNAQYAFTVENLVVDKKYKIWIIENEITTTDGSKPRSREINFTAGKADSVKEVPQQNPNNDPETDSDFNCSFTDVFCGLVKFFVWFTTFIPSVVASIAGLLSDFFLHKAIQPEMYGKSYTVGIGKMIYDSWKTVRDFSNILFIFALFVAAFMLIVDQTKIGKTNFEPKKVVGKVIIMALLVNFSLFFCRMIIQTADIFSHILYNQITVTDNSTGAIKTLLEKVGVKSISFGLVNKANPQQLMISAGVDTKDKGSTTGYLATGIIVLFVYLIFIYIFVSMLFIWMGRIIGSWMAMILAPIAFVSFSIPFIEDNDYIGFKKWLENFVHLAFLVPIYLFFVYIALSVMNLGELSQDIGTIENGGYLASTIQITLKTLIPLLASTFILLQGKTIAYKLSGVIGEMAGKISGSVTGLALGAATGGTALLARQTLGRAGNALGTNKDLMNAEAQGGLKGWGAGMLRGAGKATGAATFDPRNNKMMMDNFGKVTGKMGEKIDLGNKGLQKEGGFAKEGGIENKPGEYRDYLAKQAAERKKKKADELSADLKAVQEKEQAKLQKEKNNTQESLDSEKTKINTEAGEQSVDKIVDQATLNLAGINQLIADIDQKIIANGFNQADLDTAQAGKTAADKEITDIDEKIKKNEEMIKNGTSSQQVAAIAQKTQLDQEKQDATKKQQDADAELALQQTKQTDHNNLVSKKNTAKEDTKATQKTITNFSKYKGMTVSQMKDQIEVDKLTAEASAEGKELQKAKKDEQKNRDKIKELEKKRQEAQKEGDLVEMERLQNEIDNERKETKKLQDKTKEADDKFKAAHGDFKELEKGAKDLENDYMKAQENRLKPYEDMIQNLDIKIKQQQVIDKQEQGKLMSSLATNYDNATNNRGGFAKGISKTVSVFSAGRFGGSNFNNERPNMSASTYARNKAKGK